LVRESRALHRGWAAPPSDRHKFAAFLRRARQPTVETLFVCERTTRAIVGVFDLSQIFLGNFRSAYLGYYAHAGHAGRGYMTEAMNLVLRHTFTKVGLHRVEVNIQPDNLRSIRLAKRCGFRKEGFSRRYLKIAGRWRDHERWAITIEDWRAAVLPRGSGRKGGHLVLAASEALGEKDRQSRRPPELGG
jgi:ribosomal-protein-alanine N-acetyltransferase